ncbi:hypothetical protein HNR23_001360 [Nocardiopsis mwathae]|uniref:DUF4349 domain-containing protein n=1 Tax=Nocardiopsis mwathae TaxID=1472723 RepID=A0A7W9YG29_9ACTN|nr:DUF4349 domain-containing protein [Nocardiopsis mwathae]MBB6171300.1 hypothetical protein [Nocardiopsis mwathae]
MKPAVVEPGKGRLPAAAITVALATALLAGCSGAVVEQSAGTEDAAARDAAPQAPAPPDAEEGPGGSGEAEDSADSDDGAGVTNVAVDVVERDVIHTADLRVEVPDVHEAAADAKELVTGAGGHVGAESLGTTAGDAPRASLTLRVPQDRYEDALDGLAGLGTRKSLDREAVDVTEEVADVDSRVKSAEASLERLRELLDDAESVKDVLSVEREIDGRQEELEALQARRAALADRTALGTVNLELTPPPGKVEEDGTGSLGFAGGLREGWKAFSGLLGALAAGAGWALPFLVALIVLASPAALWWRRLRVRRTDAAAAPRPGPDATAPEDSSNADDGPAGRG